MTAVTDTPIPTRASDPGWGGASSPELEVPAVPGSGISVGPRLSRKARHPVSRCRPADQEGVGKERSPHGERASFSVCSSMCYCPGSAKLYLHAHLFLNIILCLRIDILW